MEKLLAAFVVSSLSLFAQGCKKDSLNDLRLEKLSLVEIPPKTGSEIDFGRYVSKSGELFRLKVDISSGEDIWELARGSNYLLSVNSFFCEQPSIDVSIHTGSLYWRGKDIGRESLDSDSPIASDPLKDKTYSVYLKVYSPAVPSYRKSQEAKQVNEYEAYDLVKEAEDVCLTVNGRTMAGGFKSNTVRIPKNLIRDELKKMVLAE